MLYFFVSLGILIASTLDDTVFDGFIICMSYFPLHSNRKYEKIQIKNIYTMVSSFFQLYYRSIISSMKKYTEILFVSHKRKTLSCPNPISPKSQYLPSLEKYKKMNIVQQKIVFFYKNYTFTNTQRIYEILILR